MVRFNRLPPWFAGVLCSLAASASWAQVSYDDIRTELFEQTNVWRQSQGAAVLVRDRRIDQIIQQHVEDKAACGYGYAGGAHVSCDGRTLTARATAAGLGGSFSENMAAGYRRARDRVVGPAEWGDRGGAVRECSTGSLTGLANGVFVCRQDGNVIEPGFIDAWARSTGHRNNMVSASVSFAGIGYDEGIIDAGAGCTNPRNADGHIVNQAGCNTGSIAGQMFGSMSVERGFYATATQMSSLYQAAAAPPPPVPMTPPPPPPAVTVPSLPQPPAITETVVPSAAPPAMHPNMQQVDAAVVDLYRVYGLYRYVASQLDDGLTLSESERGDIDRRLREFGYGDLRAADLEANPEALSALGPYFLSLGGDVVDTFMSYLLSDDATALNDAVARIERAMHETAPGQYDAPVAGAVLLDLAMTGVVTKRLAGMRSSLVGGPGAQTAAGLSSGQAPGQGPLIAAAQEGDDLAELMGLGAIMADSIFAESRNGSRRGNEVWARGYSGRGEQDAENVLPGFDQRQNSALLGIDFPVGRQFRVGGYVGLGRLDVDFDGNRGEGETDHYSAGLYGSWFGGKDRYAYVDTVLSMNYLDHDYQRRTRLGGQDSEARADYSSWMFGGHITTGMLFDVKSLAVDPSVSVYYNYQRSDDYQEQGDSPLRMQVQSRNIRTWGFRGGVRLSRAFRIANSALRARAGFHYLFEDPLDKRDISARFTIVPGNGGNPLVLQGRDHTRSSYQQELGFDLEVGKNMYLGGDYRLTTRSDLEDHLFSVGLRYLF